jgi:hypothetical protein
VSLQEVEEEEEEEPRLLFVLTESCARHLEAEESLHLPFMHLYNAINYECTTIKIKEVLF